MSDAVLTVAEVAERCRVSDKTVMRAIHAGELVASQLAERGTWRIRESAIDDWLERRSNRNRPPRPLADITPVGASAGAAERARRQGAGRLRVTSDMGRAA